MKPINMSFYFLHAEVSFSHQPVQKQAQFGIHSGFGADAFAISGSLKSFLASLACFESGS
jgi:hypothetical protein